MNNYEIVIDSTCDLDEKLRKRFFIYHDYIRSVIYLPGNEDYRADLEWKEFSSKEYFSIVKKMAGKLKSAFATYVDFAQVVEPILKEGKDVIIVTLSTGISGTYNGFVTYSELLLENYPERKIVVIDPLRYSAASGLLAIGAGINKNNGMSLEDNVKWINDNRNKVHEIGILDDLSFLAKNGRISATKAFFGSLIGVQPLADFTSDGKTEPFGTVKGYDVANTISLEYLKETIVNPKDQIVFVCHSDREERAMIFKEQLEKLHLVKEVIIVSLDPSCGLNVGPGLCSYFYFGSAITPNREAEIKVFEKLKEAHQ